MTRPASPQTQITRPARTPPAVFSIPPAPTPALARTARTKALDTQGVVQSYKAALEWYQMAADQGHADAQFNLGVMYDQGQGVVRSYKAALVWYRKAADQGEAEAQFKLGNMSEQG